MVEKLRRLRLARDTPFVIVEQPAKKPELPLLIQDLDLNEITELPRECLDALFKRRNIAFNLRPQELLHAAVGELRLEFIDRSGRITEQAGKCGFHASLRTHTFENDAIENLNLID